MKPTMKHFWLRDKYGFPCTCVATVKLDNGSVAFAVATHNPQDRFSRDHGRIMAYGRLILGQWAGVVLKHERDKKSGIIDMIFLNPEMPQRAREAAYLWIKQHLFRSTLPVPMKVETVDVFAEDFPEAEEPDDNSTSIFDYQRHAC